MKITSGMLASKGEVKGKIVHFHSFEDAFLVDENSIVVADRISKEYTEVIQKCKAFIATHGGITSHASILCRELKKPCIVSCENAYDFFPNGKTIKLDATNMNFEVLP